MADLNAGLLRCLVAEVQALRRAIGTAAPSSPSFPSFPSGPTYELPPVVAFQQPAMSAEAPSSGIPEAASSADSSLSTELLRRVLEQLELLTLASGGVDAAIPVVMPELVTIPDSESVMIVDADSSQHRLIRVLAFGYNDGDVLIGPRKLRFENYNGILAALPYRTAASFRLRPGDTLWAIGRESGGEGFVSVTRLPVSLVRPE